MDWDKNGMVNFKEFLFAFTGWVGIEDEEEGEATSEEVIPVVPVYDTDKRSLECSN